MTSHKLLELGGWCKAALGSERDVGPDCWPHTTLLQPQEPWALDSVTENLPGPPSTPQGGGVAPRASTTAGLTVGAIAVVEGGRVCRRSRREGGRSYVCRVCERRFPRAYLLLVHERTHTPLTCPVCGRTFRRSEHLRMHRETHGGGNKRPA
ncbi:protein sister of odd and bowel-like [Homarus americanus]|uniref:protein sister of odd and bowel-like n=1 Tax=Homarus americanus TaxID=6706 RepID=UPI001C459210|nr:protein sister of odd and bowel-like [Homarus americanus]